jgi:hypothetical protein
MHRPTRLVALLPILSALIASAGCATSIQPLATPEVRTDVAGIAGDWIVERSLYQGLSTEARIRIVRRTVGRYDFEITQNGETSSWDGDAILLGKTMFADLVPHFEAEAEKAQDLLMIATHVFFIMEREEQTLKLYGFDHSRLDPLAQKEKLAVASPDSHRLVFIAESKKLQEFFQEHGAEFQRKDPVVILKKKP